MSKFILLDRDGVINQRTPSGYVTSWADFRFLDGSLEGLRLLTENDYGPIVVSNQACVGKGLLTSSELEVITRCFVEEVEKNGGRIHGVYYCTHREEDACECRKPRPGLLLEAQREHHFSFADTFLIGDSERDLLAAFTVGCPALLISDEIHEKLEKLAHPPQGVFCNLYAAAQFILARDSDSQAHLGKARHQEQRRA